MDAEQEPDWWQRWSAVVETRLGNLEVGQHNVSERLGIIEHDQKMYMASVQAIREYFDGSLRSLREEVASGFARLTRIVELHAQRIDTHEAFVQRTDGVLTVVKTALPLLYTLIGGVVMWLLRTYGHTFFK